MKDISNKRKIYTTDNGIIIVDSKIKTQILNILEHESKESEIVKITGKSKSTISVHLNNLMDQGIIDYKPHPIDRRSKLFFIKAKYIGEIYNRGLLIETPTKPKNILNPLTFYKTKDELLKSTFLKKGLTLDPIFEEVGTSMGKKLYNQLEIGTEDEFFKRIQELYKDLDLGSLKITKTEERIIVKNNNCKECVKVLEIPISTCAFNKGLLKGLMEQYYNYHIIIDEVECRSKNDDACTFLIEKE
ncbi:MAG: ArsR family transcriptional regulator [Methanobacteriaceae archaeon]|nr:ArsR family transcriptional regulator [Methanobacteriaceae archaeon]